MSFRERNIAITYKSVGDDTISKIINKLLIDSISYKRSVGYFSSSSLDFISPGIVSLVKNKGRIKLITSPNLSKEDINAIALGYADKNETIYNKFKHEFNLSIKDFDNDNLQCLYDLILSGFLDIKIVVKEDFGIYHDKVAILEDFLENKVVFVGSNNETASGYGGNYEKVRVFKSWDNSNYVTDEEEDFDRIWNNEDDFLETLEFNDALKKDVIHIIKNTIENKKNKKQKYELYDYQKEAIESWKNKNYNGFYVMATGTGKTVTSIYSIKKLMEEKMFTTVIVVPYKHLITQWGEDIEDIFGETVTMVKVSGENPGWETELKDRIFINNLSIENRKPIIVISTLASFYDDKFMNTIKLEKNEKLLIVDEAHNFLSKIIQNKYKIDYEYKLGLSATPVFGNDSTKTKILIDFFGGVAFDLPIEKAIGKFLVNYNYYPIFVNLTEDEEEEFNKYKKLMMRYRDKDGRITDSDKYAKAYRAKLRVLAMASEKVNNITKYIDNVNSKDHFIIYCSDGRIGDKKHLEKVVDLLNDKGFKPSQFTCEENMEDRVSLIEHFNKGYISTLVAIRCLDEGINIPSIHSALILSSNDNLREFVQRRGRILRKYKNKSIANIYDVIVLPFSRNKSIAEIEFRRYYEYAKLALNKDNLLEELEYYKNEYNLTQEDISFDVNYLDEENEID